MVSSKRFLMFLQKEGSGIVVETIDEGHWKNLKLEAEQKGMTCRSLSIEKFYPDYRGYRYFDLRNPVTNESFSLDYVLHSWEIDKKHYEGHVGTDEWFIH